MPRRIASVCRSSEEKWWPINSSGTPSTGASCGTDHPRRLVRAVVVRHLGDDRDLVEVMRGGRRRGHPLEALRAPGIGVGALAPDERDDQIDEDDEEAEAEQRGAGGGGHVQCLEVLGVLIVTPRHSKV